MTTYLELQAQIDRLAREAEEIRRAEVTGVIARIRSAITLFELTPADLGFGKKAPSAKTRLDAKPTARKRSTKKVKYRDQDGNTWVGRGKRPDWLRAALAAGHSLEDFRV